MHKSIDAQIFEHEQQIRRLSEEREKTSQEIKALHGYLDPGLAELNRLLEYEADLAKLIRSRQMTVNRLTGQAVHQSVCLVIVETRAIK